MGQYPGVPDFQCSAMEMYSIYVRTHFLFIAGDMYGIEVTYWKYILCHFFFEVKNS